jgi:hypothetical protein
VGGERSDGDDGALARRESLVREVDALWVDGPPARGVVIAIARDGATYFEVRALSLRCEGCGVIIPQSRTRISREARRTWLLFHARCTDDARATW